MRLFAIKVFLKVLATAALVFGLVVLLKPDFARLKTFLGVNPVWRSLKAEREKVKNKAMLVTINHYRPDLSQWKSFFAGQAVVDKSFLKDSIRYYKTIVDYLPDMAEAHHMLAVCHYLLGDKQAAFVHQQTAVVLEPRFFAAWYDLGIMYYHQGQFKQSAESFHRALNILPVATLKIIETSRIYGEIIYSSGMTDIVNAQKMQAGYNDAARFFQASLRRLRKEPAGVNEGDFQVRLF